jgi:hypothetical protein
MTSRSVENHDALTPPLPARDGAPALVREKAIEIGALLEEGYDEGDAFALRLRRRSGGSARGLVE